MLVPRRANVSRKGGHWSDDDYDGFDGDREVGRLYCVTDMPDSPWFWEVSFQLTGRESYGNAPTLEEAKAAVKGEYEKWKGTEGSLSN
jgi:hypothetical protein